MRSLAKLWCLFKHRHFADFGRGVMMCDRCGLVLRPLSVLEKNLDMRHFCEYLPLPKVGYRFTFGVSYPQDYKPKKKDAEI